MLVIHSWQPAGCQKACVVCQDQTSPLPLMNLCQRRPLPLTFAFMCGVLFWLAELFQMLSSWMEREEGRVWKGTERGLERDVETHPVPCHLPSTPFVARPAHQVGRRSLIGWVNAVARILIVLPTGGGAPEVPRCDSLLQSSLHISHLYSSLLLFSIFSYCKKFLHKATFGHKRKSNKALSPYESSSMPDFFFLSLLGPRKKKSAWFKWNFLGSSMENCLMKRYYHLLKGSTMG